MSSFRLNGSNGDEVCAQLKANFEAREAQFNSALQAALSGQGPSVAAAAPAAGPPVQAPAAAKSHASAGWSLDGKSDRLPSRNDDSRGRTRTSFRPR